MMKLIMESGWDDYDYDPGDYYEHDGEYDTYEVDYYTYYQNENEMEVPVCEVELTDVYELNLDDDTDPDIEVEKLKKEIDVDVRAGHYPGLYVHHIKIGIISNYRQVDVDDWAGESIIDEATYESDEVDLPEDWDPSDPDYYYLSDWCDGLSY